MSKLIATRHDLLQDAVLDFFICGGRKLSTLDSEAHHEHIPVAEHRHGTKRSRQTAAGATRVSMERHGWKQTGKPNSLWVFEHRWPHLRDHAAGRNHRLTSN